MRVFKSNMHCGAWAFNNLTKLLLMSEQSRNKCSEFDTRKSTHPNTSN